MTTVSRPQQLLSPDYYASSQGLSSVVEGNDQTLIISCLTPLPTVCHLVNLSQTLHLRFPRSLPKSFGWGKTILIL